MIELKVPKVGESITEVQIGDWLKREGDEVHRDEPVVVIETDKATVELPAPADGRIASVVKRTGEKAAVGEVIGTLEEGAVAKTGDGARRPEPPRDETRKIPAVSVSRVEPAAAGSALRAGPAARRAMAESGVSLGTGEVQGTGPGGRVLQEDLMRALETRGPAPGGNGSAAEADEEIVPMSPLRRTIAARLVAAQSEAALLTTFNEVDMSEVQALRKEHQEAFTARYGVKLGMMGFFVKAVVDALKLVPAVNAEVRGSSIVYKNHFDIGVAVGGGKGLVVPVLKGADRMSFAEIEKGIGELARKAKENRIAPDDLAGGTFTISNGGIYGSMLSTPIVNPPQSGILGLHAIQDRPVARAGEVVIRPMMYVALTYDHRVVDGREAVTFLKRVKETIESPARMLIEV